MRFLRFLISRTFWSQVAIAVVLAGLGFVAMNVGLRAFTRHSERIAVPGVVGFGQEGAEAILLENGLTPVIIDSLYNADGVPGAVVEQDPSEGTEVKGTRNVYLTVYRSSPPSERLEVEEGMDAGVARILLDLKGFKYRERYEPSEELAGLVLQIENIRGDSVGPDDRVLKGADLVLVIGERTERQLELPDFVGLAWTQATAMIEKVGLAPGRFRWSRMALDGRDSAMATISSQTPDYVPGRRVTEGSEVDFFIELPEPAVQAAGDESLFE